MDINLSDAQNHSSIQALLLVANLVTGFCDPYRTVVHLVQVCAGSITRLPSQTMLKVGSWFSCQSFIEGFLADWVREYALVDLELELRFFFFFLRETQECNRGERH